ncbi:MAG: MBL fold metallo-hydrolase [Ktedonobacteraceae bacterium]|nr:MBL fold metallo-hydrolase [Ktedonobacteraceae bacterium]
MEITWIGHACFQLRGKNVTLVTDPFSVQPQGASVRLGKLNASIVTSSHNHSGHMNASVVGGNPHVVRGPGEYEISDVLITGVASYHDDKSGQQYRRNTIYVIHMDEIAICHLGDLGHALQEEQLEEVADADVLLIPIGGQHTIHATQAVEIISQVEPRVVIPMHYQTATGEGLDPLDKFCREMGVESLRPQPRLVITRSTVPTELQVILLTPRGQA